MGDLKNQILMGQQIRLRELKKLLPILLARIEKREAELTELQKGLSRDVVEFRHALSEMNSLETAVTP